MNLVSLSWIPDEEIWLCSLSTGRREDTNRETLNGVQNTYTLKIKEVERRPELIHIERRRCELQCKWPTCFYWLVGCVCARKLRPPPSPVLSSPYRLHRKYLSDLLTFYLFFPILSSSSYLIISLFFSFSISFFMFLVLFFSLLHILTYFSHFHLLFCLLHVFHFYS